MVEILNSYFFASFHLAINERVLYVVEWLMIESRKLNRKYKNKCHNQPQSSSF